MSIIIIINDNFSNNKPKHSPKNEGGCTVDKTNDHDMAEKRYGKR